MKLFISLQIYKNFLLYIYKYLYKYRLKGVMVMDKMVLKTQEWLNITYGVDSRFNKIDENGNTG